MPPAIQSPSFNPGIMPWPQQHAAFFPSGALPLSPQLERPHNTLQGYDYQNMYYQSYQTATPAPGTTPGQISEPYPSIANPYRVIPPLVNHTPEGYDLGTHDFTSNMNDMDSSCVPVEEWPQEGSGSTTQECTSQHRTSYPESYNPQSSGPDRHNQQQSTGFAARQSQDPQGTPWITKRWSSYRYDSASQ